MLKKFTWITGLAVVLVAVLAVGVFCAPKASAAEINYGSTNLDAIADPTEKALVQGRIALLEQMIANPGAALQQLATYCPICDATVQWTEWNGAVAVSGGESKHLMVTSDRTISASWPLEFYGDGAKAHVLLAANVQLSGPILCNTGCTNTDITIMGTGSITSGRLFYLRGNAKLTLIGGSYIPTSATYPSIDALKETTAGAEINIYPYTVLGPATKDTSKVITNINAKYTTINMYGGEIRNGQTTANEMGGNVGLQTDAVLNMYGGTISNGSNTAANGGNIATYASSATINIFGGTVSGGSGTNGANIYGYGYTNISGTALITGGSGTYGGNIYQAYRPVTISGGKVQGGTATAAGGNIYSKADTTISGTAVIANGTATSDGGNIYQTSGKTLTISGGTIIDGTSKWGGCIYLPSGKAEISGGVISGGYAYFRGGNFYIENSATVNMTGGTVTKGEVEGSNTNVDRTGGNIYMTGTGKVTISGGTVSEGKAMRGGNVCLRNGTVEITGVAKIKDGVGVYQGGNVWVGNNGKDDSTKTTGTLIISGGRVSGGKSADGGNLYAQDGTLTISNGVITGGQAYCDDEAKFDENGNIIVLGSKYKGGNIFADIDVNISGGTISAGESRTSWGGNIYIQDHTLTVTGGVITGGKAVNKNDGRGGNIAGKNAVINISGNAAVQSGKAHEGGNIYIDEGTCTLNVSGGTVSGGKADKGGNIYAAQKQLVDITGGEISGGVAQQGGNVYVGYNGKLKQTAGTISDGSCLETGTNGGDIDFDDLLNDPNGGSVGAASGICDGTDVYLCFADYIMLGGTVAADQMENASVYTDGGKVYLSGGATVTGANIKITESGKLFVDNNWAGSASVVFPVIYTTGNEVSTMWAVNGTLSVAEDWTVTFTPGGTFAQGMLQHGVAPFDAIVATGVEGKLRLGTATFVAMIDTNYYKTLNQALTASQEGDVIILGMDCSLDGDLFLKKGRTLNLNGCKLTVTGEVTAANKTAHIIDTTNGNGVLVTEKSKVAFNRQNSYLPVWVNGEGFHFVSHQFGTLHRTAQTHPDKVADETAVQFVFWLDSTAECFLAQQLADGGSDNGVEAKIKMSWVNSAGISCEQYFTFPEENVKDYTAVWETGSMYLTVKNANTVKDLQFTAMVVYDNAVRIVSEPYSISWN